MCHIEKHGWFVGSSFKVGPAFYEVPQTIETTIRFFFFFLSVRNKYTCLIHFEAYLSNIYIYIYIIFFFFLRPREIFMYFFNIKYHLIVSWGWILVSTFILSKLLLLMFSMFNEGVETNTQGKKKKKGF